MSARRAVGDLGGQGVRVGFYLIVTAVLGTLWRTAAGSGTVAGYSGLELSWYIAFSEAVTCALDLRMIEVLGDDIVSGAISVDMLRPASVVTVRMVNEVGRALPRLLACVVTGVVLVRLTAGPHPGSTSALGLALVACLLAIAVNVAAQHAFAALAFWLHDTRATWFLYQKFVFVLGGMLLPLEVLPDGVGAVARWLPFAAMSYVPARLAAGYVEPELLAGQVAWLVVLVVVARWIFAAGERRYVTVGA